MRRTLPAEGVVLNFFRTGGDGYFHSIDVAFVSDVKRWTHDSSPVTIRNIVPSPSNMILYVSDDLVSSLMSDSKFVRYSIDGDMLVHFNHVIHLPHIFICSSLVGLYFLFLLASITELVAQSCTICFIITSGP
ncbi:hypothetical protein TNCT_69131 [Trichonephila clavata]|uniref:Uncharacterized protein n=1 Tax=Trichonephila clavata TaxID=2740835 RepID=A0A8X6F1N2_TRICU|nr:hypothetical protein TNCT_69131 [Trichonephila clavata]